MAAEHVDAARLAERVQLIDEDNARRVLHGLGEKIAHPRRADADEHLDEIGTGDAEEWHPGFARHRPRQQRFAGARRADQEHAFRQMAAQPLVFFRVFKKLDNFHQLILRLVDTRHVRETHAGGFLDIDLRLALADLHQTAAGGAAHTVQ